MNPKPTSNQSSKPCTVLQYPPRIETDWNVWKDVAACMSFWGYACSTTWYCNTGWRRLIGSPKLQIIFHKRATKYRALLRKMTYKDKASYESSPPCISKAWLVIHVICNICDLYYMCDMTHSHVWHDSFRCVTWRIHMWDMTHSHDLWYICNVWCIRQASLLQNIVSFIGLFCKRDLSF